MSENENLRAIVADMQSKLDRLQNEPTTREGTLIPLEKSVVSPFWDCTYMTGATMTSGVDWDPLFDDSTATNYMRYRLAAGYGSFDKGNLGFGMQRRHVIMWDSPTAGTVRCLLSGPSVYNADTDAAIQVKMNGTFTEYAAGSGPAGLVSQIITLTVSEGRNRLVICADIDPDTIQFCGLLFQDDSQWVNPQDLPSYRY